MTRIATIGYQGAALQRFVATLRDGGVEELIDVRSIAWSRRPEFVKRSIAATLSDAGIGYRHVEALGNPLAGRRAAGIGGVGDFAAAYEAHLDENAARAAMAGLAALAAEKRLCLMCMERDHAQCHRGLLAARLAADWGLEVEHLSVGATQMSLF